MSEAAAANLRPPRRTAELRFQRPLDSVQFRGASEAEIASFLVSHSRQQLEPVYKTFAARILMFCILSSVGNTGGSGIENRTFGNRPSD